ncbi:MAG: hypothetical protein ACOY93_01875 [Bacillota bacterium]
MNVSQVNQAANLWAMKKLMTVTQDQVMQIVQSAPKASLNLEPHKGTLLDVRV